MVALASAKGSPGVTTALVALAGVWPRPVLVAECDPNGGDLAARFGLPPTPGLVSLASTARHGLGSERVWAHTQRLPGGLAALLGVQVSEQAEALGPLWPQLAGALASLEVDVLVDAGQLSHGSPVLEVLERADLVVLLARPTVEGVTHVVARLARLEQRGLAPVVVLVGEHPYSRRAVEATLRAEGLRARVLGVLVDDPRAAAGLGGRSGATVGLARSALVRSARQLTSSIHAQLAARSDRMRREGGRGRER
jgi:MinD-like ATPase involved in chromosome partitioning or flagellar assembly